MFRYHLVNERYWKISTSASCTEASGKSTLVKAILGLLPVQSGTVSVFGKEIARNPRLRTRIGYVPQHSRIDMYFPLTVREVVISGTYGRLGLFRRPGKPEHV